MNRRTFLFRTAGLAAGGLLGRSALRAAAAAPAADRPGPVGPPPTAFKPLRRQTGIFTGRGGTIAWLASPGAVIVVDTQFPDTAAVCLAGLAARSAAAIEAVINTHHHADHTSGNPIFKPVARTIVAHTRVPGLQFAAAEKAGTLDQQVYADTTFADVWRHSAGGQGGDEIVTAQYFGPAHTGGDAVVWFERANVVHLGDLVFNRLYPYIDRPGGASVRNWIKRLEEAHGTFPADAIYVFGHGSARFGVTGTRDDLLVMRDLLAALVERVQQGIAAGRTRGEITALDNLPGFPDFHTPPPNRLPAILGTVYDELTAHG